MLSLLMVVFSGDGAKQEWQLVQPCRERGATMEMKGTGDLTNLPKPDVS